MIMKYGIKFYMESGEFGWDEYKNNFYEILQLYMDNKDKKHPTPTLWVHDGNDYVRVHDFNFDKLSPETYKKYLSERILATDYILNQIDTQKEDLNLFF